MTREEELDAKTKPIREALSRRLNLYGCGYTSGWNPVLGRWEYSAYGWLQGLRIEIEEDGSKISFSGFGEKRGARTARGALIALNWFRSIAGSKKGTLHP